jgi:hypothetical protein
MLAVRLVAVAVLLAACGPTARPASGDRRGDTHGRMFDFVSQKPDGSEWTIRIRGDSMWLAYATGEEARDLGPVTLGGGERDRLWSLVDEIAVDEDEELDPEEDDGEEVGTVLLRIRQPTGDGDHDIISIYLARDTDNESVLDLASFLVDLVKKHHGLEPAF